MKPTPEALIDLIGELGHEVHNLLDDCETSGDVGEEVHTITTEGLEKVSTILDRIDELPFEEPGCILGPGAMLQAAIKQTFLAPAKGCGYPCGYDCNGACFDKAPDALAEVARLTAERDALRKALEQIEEQSDRPEYRSLEVGFRHSPLTGNELVERLRETCLFIAQDARAALDSSTTHQTTPA